MSISRDSKPLAERLRPKNFDELVGQEHVMGEDGVLRKVLQRGRVFSCILYGPPGSGKSSIAELIRRSVDAEFFALNGASHGVTELKQVISRAEELKKYGRQTVLFIDEIHRLNKSQQDHLLSRVEDGSIVLVGATTENPSFEIIPPLLSRCRVIFLKPLSKENLIQILKRALVVDERLSKMNISVGEEVLQFIADISRGDARFALNTLEIALEMAETKNMNSLDLDLVKSSSGYKSETYRKTADEHYDFASAFIKSLRGSDPDAALYYMVRMIEAGEDPKFIARRMIVLASEDIGLADPMALLLAVSAFSAVEYVGLPECVLNLAEAAVYLSAAPKSNSIYKAVQRAKGVVERSRGVQVPLFLRNPATNFMKDAGYGQGYEYPHDFGGFVKKTYMPEELRNVTIYAPGDTGKESLVKKRLSQLWGNLKSYETKKQ